MQLGMLGLGRMRSSMVRRLLKALAMYGAEAAASLEDYVRRLKPPRAVWSMLMSFGNRSNKANAETTPLADPGSYQYSQSPDLLAAYAGRLFRFGRGRWTIAAAIDE